MNVLRSVTQQRTFNFEAPQIYYDKELGEVKMKPKAAVKPKKIINNTEELEAEKQALLRELGIDDAKLNEEDIDDQVLAAKLKIVNDNLMNNYQLDPSQFYVFSRDFMRVDIGLIIQRAPIFMHIGQKDVDHLKLKTQVMNDYWCNQKQFTQEFADVAKLNEDVFADNPYSS